MTPEILLTSEVSREGKGLTFKRVNTLRLQYSRRLYGSGYRMSFFKIQKNMFEQKMIKKLIDFKTAGTEFLGRPGGMCGAAGGVRRG